MKIIKSNIPVLTVWAALPEAEGQLGQSGLEFSQNYSTLMQVKIWLKFRAGLAGCRGFRIFLSPSYYPLMPSML
jgi:hypothetical protein